MAPKEIDRLAPEALLSDAIRGVGAATFFPVLLDYMRSAAAFRGAFVVALPAVGAPVYLYDNVRAERRAMVVDRWLDGAWLLDPFVAARRSGHEDLVVTLQDVAPDRFTQSEYYRTYYRSVKLRDELGLFVQLHGRHLFFSLGRLAGERRFLQSDVKRLFAIQPIIAALCEQHFSRRPSEKADFAGDGDAMSVAMERIDKDLTEREIEVVRHILQGHSSRSAALLLNLSPATVKVHRKNIYRKLGISSQSALFSLFLQTVAESR
jgi:DNA-binding CsgD family transcriptional regulator